MRALGHNVRMAAHRLSLKQIEPSPSAEQAAAIVAALERFIRATSASHGPAEQLVDPWRRAAVLEGISCEPHADARDPWINT